MSAEEIINQIEVPPEKVVEALHRSELGAALWRAAVAEARNGVLAERIDVLQRQKSSAGTPPPRPQE
jgi:hypothetical protein